MRFTSIATILAGSFVAGTLPADSTRVFANPDLAITAVGTSVLISVIANDDAGGQELCLAQLNRPDAGTAKIVGNAVRYTPRHGFIGVDRFTYRAETSSGRGARGEVLVGVGLGRRLRIEGQVTDSPIRAARVEVSTGLHDFVTTTDDDGRYAVDVVSLLPEAFLIASATGTSDTGAAVDFRSVLGQFSRLVLEAGADAVLSPAENSQTNITNLSTAQYVLMERAIDGQPPSTDDELRMTAQAVDPSQMLELAAVQRLVIDEREPLPAAVASVFELIQDPAQLASFRASLEPGRLGQIIGTLPAIPGLLPTFGDDRLRPAYALVVPGAPGTIRVGSGGPLLLELDGTGPGVRSGTGRLIEDLPNAAPEVTWQVGLTGNLLVIPQNPRVVERLANDFACTAAPQRQVRDSITRLSIIRLVDGDAVDQLQIAFATQREYLPRFDCPTRSPEIISDLIRYLGFELRSDRRGELPIIAPPGRWAIPYYQPERWTDGGPWGYDVYDFGDAPSSPSTWEIADGRLRVNHVMSRSTEYIRLQHDGAAADGVFAIVQIEDGTRAVDYSIAAAEDGTLSFSESALTALWRSGFDISSFAGDGFPDTGFFVRLDAGGIGRNEFIDPQGRCSLGRGSFNWGVQNGDMFYTSTPDVPAGIAGTRRWIPVARSKSRIYVVEELAFFANPPFFSGSIDQRANFYEPSTTASACGLPAPPAPPVPPPPPLEPQIICLYERPPAGWFKTELTVAAVNSRGKRCPTIPLRRNNAWRIDTTVGKPPMSTMRICRDQPPAGWVKRETVFGLGPCEDCPPFSLCHMHDPNGAIIQNLEGFAAGSLLTMCYGQPSIRNAQGAGWVLGKPRTDSDQCDKTMTQFGAVPNGLEVTIQKR